MEQQGPPMIIVLVQVVIAIISIVSLWKVFVKAGKPGWGAVIPFYNLYLLLVLAGKPWWWIILFFVPIVNLVIAFLAMLAWARTFGKSTGFAVGLYFLGFIFFPILAFDDSTYSPPGDGGSPSLPPSSDAAPQA
jgi:hypothetical protein